MFEMGALHCRLCRLSTTHDSDVTIVPYLCLLIFCRHLVGKKFRERLVTVIALKHALLVSHWSYNNFLKLTDSEFEVLYLR